MSRAAKGYEKYGKEGMQALAKAGREGKALDPIRNRYDKYDDKSVEEGRVEMPSSTVKSIYYPDKAQSPIKKSRFAYDAPGETNFKKYPDQTSRPAGMNPDPASRYAMGEEGGFPTTPKQKRFAALADPKNRMTQADRIAGAKKR